MEKLKFTLHAKNMTEQNKKEAYERTIESLIQESISTKMHTYKDVAMMAIEEILERKEINSSNTKSNINQA